MEDRETTTTSGDQAYTGTDQALYRNLIEQMPAVVYVDTDELGARALFVSPQAAELFGVDPSLFFEEPAVWTRLVDPADVEAVRARWTHAVLTGTRFDMEYRWIRPDGGVVWVRDTSVPFVDAEGRRLRQGVMFDITDAKRAEEDLRSSEARYRLLVEHLPAIVYQVAPDDDRRTLWVSPAIEGALGYSRLEWLDQPDMWMELLHPDDREPTLAAYDEHNRTGAPWDRQYRLIASDGRAQWFRDVGRLIRDESGAPLYWLGVQLDMTDQKRVESDLRSSRDDLERRVHERTGELEEANALMALEIGERRRAETELRDAEQRFRTLVEQIPAVTYIWGVGADGETLILYTSPRIEQLLGFSVDEWRSVDFWISRVHPDDRARVVAATLRSERTGQPFLEEYRYLDKRGEIVWVIDRATLLERDAVGRPSIFQGVTVDITEHVDAERRTAETETAFRRLVEHSPAVTYVEAATDDPAQARLTYLSPQAEAIMGRPVSDILDDPGHFGRSLHPEDRDRVIAANAYANRTGEPFDEEYRVIGDDGRIVWLHNRATLVRDDAGRPLEWHGVALDVTARRADPTSGRARENGSSLEGELRA